MKNNVFATLAWVEYYNDVQGKTCTDVLCLTARDYNEAMTIITQYYHPDLVSVKLMQLEDNLCFINEEIAQHMIAGDYT